MVKYIKFVLVLATFTWFGVVLMYLGTAYTRNKVVSNIIQENDPVTSQSFSCSIVQDIVHSRIKNAIRKITEKYKQIHDTQVPRALFVTEPKNLIGYCHVPKVASTLLMSNFAELNNLNGSIIQTKLKAMTLHDYLFAKFSKSYPEDEDQLSKLFTFVFIRHPFERLVSAFHDKFITLQQLNIMEPFVKYYMKSYGITDKLILKKPWVKRHINVTFENFVKFVLHENSLKEKISPPSWHWWPFSDVCKLNDINYNFIGKIESLEQDVECLLQHFPGYTKFQNIRDKMKSKVNAQGHHNANMTMEYFSQLSKHDIRNLYKMYETDFVMGGYEYPQSYIDKGKDMDTKT